MVAEAHLWPSVLSVGGGLCWRLLGRSWFWSSLLIPLFLCVEQLHCKMIIWCVRVPLCVTKVAYTVEHPSASKHLLTLFPIVLSSILTQTEGGANLHLGCIIETLGTLKWTVSPVQASVFQEKLTLQPVGKSWEPEGLPDSQGQEALHLCCLVLCPLAAGGCLSLN